MSLNPKRFALLIEDFNDKTKLLHDLDKIITILIEFMRRK